MDRQQIIWLVVRAFGLYLLIQAIMLVPDLLAGLYATRAYSNLVSSMGPDNNNLASTARAATSMYRSLLFGPLLKFVLFSSAGIYLLRRGGFVMRLLQHAPDTSAPVGGDDDAQQVVGRERRERLRRDMNLTEEEANEMTVKERLSAVVCFKSSPMPWNGVMFRNSNESYAKYIFRLTAFRLLLNRCSGRRPTDRSTRAAGACFATRMVRRRLREIAPPCQLSR